MSSYRTRKDAFVYRVGPGSKGEERIYRDPARLDFRNAAEMKEQLLTFARSKWPTARKLDIDLHSQQIIVNQRVVAAFRLYEPRERLAEPTGMSL